MFSVSRFCHGSSVFSNLKYLVGVPCRNLVRSGAPRRYSSLVSKQPLGHNLKIKNFLRGTATTAVRLSADVSKKGQKSVGYWLLTCSGMVFVAVVIGGVTRLTESGLSMVTWKLLGEQMPRTEAEWEAEFQRYQQYPEFKIHILRYALLRMCTGNEKAIVLAKHVLTYLWNSISKNKEISLKEFKFIWHMEYGHRQWGRAIGAVFLIPAAYFWARGRLSPGLKKRILAFGTLIGAQGLMGWYMVKSGLEDRFHGENDVPRVSQYRLAAHLGLAFILYTLLFWSALDVLIPAQTVSIASKAALKASRKFRMMAHSAKGLVFLTAVSGAFVAGLDAGLVYNSFPKMADKWIPDDILALSPKLVNLTENPTTVQFNHRILGTTTLAVITAVWLLSRKRVLPPRAYTAAAVFGAVAYLQVALGITTLLTYVPTSIAALHQTGSLTLLSAAVWLTHELKKLPK